jgi:hypothetical protein
MTRGGTCPEAEPARNRPTHDASPTEGALCAPLSRLLSQADARTRTGDPFITSEVLYQLSYVGRRAQSSSWFSAAYLSRAAMLPSPGLSGLSALSGLSGFAGSALSGLSGFPDP